MAVELGPLVAGVKQSITLDALANRTIAIDAYNTIYQFLSIIRQPDGTPLTDRKGRVTSHLSGLFYRSISMIEHGITPVYVFDGIPPVLKERTIAARMNRRKEALEEWNKALEAGMVEEARTHAMASTRITKEIVASGKELLERMGIVYIQAPSEGEAQAARMTRDGAVYASCSQDYDLFLFGSDTVVRNLAISGRRKLPKKNVYIEVNPERILLKDLLNNLGVSQRQLIWMGMLMGTDFDSGIEGVGPKTALKIAKTCSSLDDVVKAVKEKGKEFDADPVEVEKLFTNPDVMEIGRDTLQSEIRKSRPDKEAMVSFMCGEHDFLEDRISKFADTLTGTREKSGQKSIGGWA